MSDHSQIQWTDATWNPTTGCTKVSPGCANCYIERTPAFRIAGRTFEKGHIPLQLHENRLEQPLHWRKPRRVFVNSLSDLFHADVPDSFIDHVFAVMALCPQHTFQVLTKRVERMRDYMRDRARHHDVTMSMQDREYGVAALLPANGRSYPRWPNEWPLLNVWLGVSVENQHFADERIPLLLQTPAAIRFISAEPLLGPVTLAQFYSGTVTRDWIRGATRLDWVIVGGESGPQSRPSDVAWIRSLRNQCRLAGVACFIKQLGQRPRCALTSAGQFGEGVTIGRHDAHSDEDVLCTGVEMRLRDRKGGAIEEWPADLRVREWPKVRA
jgi:protein gp37